MTLFTGLSATEETCIHHKIINKHTDRPCSGAVCNGGGWGLQIGVSSSRKTFIWSGLRMRREREKKRDRERKKETERMIERGRERERERGAVPLTTS